MRRNDGHQFAIRLLDNGGTRIIIENCDIIAAGADTLSLWNSVTGMYYHNNCYFEGGTDMVCPRGTCYISNSEFYIRNQSAVLWHDGSKDENMKLVVVNSKIDGISGYYLGRRHYDAQFYIIDTEISGNMSNAPIFRVTYSDTSRNKPNLWGDRYYFYNTECIGKDLELDWLKDNLSEAAGSPAREEITPVWTFNGEWDPVAYLASLKEDIDNITAGL